MGIRAKLVFCLLAVLIPLCAVSTFAFHLFDQQLKERTETALSNTQQLEALRISEILAGYAQTAHTLATDPQVQELVTAIDSYSADRPLQPIAAHLRSKAGIIGSAAAEL
ncbi:MAG: hypothetical protein ACJAUZ_001582, partial [Flavobacteriaceae bacterium]